MKPKGKHVLICLVFGLGIVLLLVAAMPDRLTSDAVFVQQAAGNLSESHSSVRFSERAMRLEPVNSGEISSGFILVENRGNKIITDVAIRAGCRCSDVTLSQTDINPGDSIRIDFSIDTRGKFEDFVENFLLSYTEDEQSLFDVFHVTVPILAPGKLVANPPRLLFNRARGGEQFSKIVELRVKDLPEGETVDIVGFSTPDWIFMTFVRQDSFWELTLSGILPDKSGRYVGFVQIRSSSQRYSEMIIPIIVEYAVDSGSPK